MKKLKKEKTKTNKSRLILFGSFLIIGICTLTISLTLLNNYKNDKEEDKNLNDFFEVQEQINIDQKEVIEETLSTSSKVYSDVKLNCSGYRNDVEKINIRIEELCLKMKDLDDLIADNIDSLDEYEKIIFDGMILHYLTNENIEEKLNKKKDFVVRYKKSCYIKVSKWFHEEVYR